jgi:fluoride exporter
MTGWLGAPWTLWVAVAFGSALGGVARYAFGLLAARYAGSGWPWGTWLVNVIGCLIIGLVAGWWAGRGQPPLPRALVMVGVLGGFTTYSSFALESVQLWQQGLGARTAAYVLTTTLVCLLAAGAGSWLWQQWESMAAR